MNAIPRFQSKQNGAALVISLVILLGVTAIAVSSMHGSSVQQKVVANYIDDDLAFQAAEIALREGETWIMDQKANGETLGPGDTLPNGNVLGVEEASSGWWVDDDSTAWDKGTTISSAVFSLVDDPPLYVVEALGRTAIAGGSKDATEDSGKLSFYRITSRGVGLAKRSDNTAVHVVVLQTTFSMPL